MNHTDRPVLVPTALSHGVLLWSVFAVLCFGIAVYAYHATCRYCEARAALDRRVPTPVAAELFSLEVPSWVARYSLRGNRLTMNVHSDRAVPLTCIVASRDPAFAYRALDLNPAFISQRIQAVLKDEGVAAAAPGQVPVVLSTVLRHTRYGQSAALAYFKFGDWDGIAYGFYVGDISYCLVTVWDQELARSPDELRARVESLMLGAVWRDSPERIVRPVVNSAEQDAAEHARIVTEVDCERALWALYAARVEAEPEAALLPALEHFRRLLALSASVREERELLASDDFRRYERLQAQRAEIVQDWLLLLDKHVAVGDLAAAERQADFIVRHATLEDESLSRQRAAQLLAEVKAQLAAQAAEAKED